MFRFLTIFALAAQIPPSQSPAVRFRNVAEAAGLRFQVENDATPQKRLIESMAGGLAVFDYNNDGRPDIFFTNGAASNKDDPKHWNRLFRNDGDWKFTDVTAEAGLAGQGYAMGAAVADFDNDGNVDLFVAQVGGSRLYRNLGNGKFEDVTAASGIADELWAVAAAWVDVDNDGLLDLWITHYTQWPPATDRYCGDQQKGLRDYCHPKYFPGLPNRLYRNLGNGKFEDISVKSGVAAHRGRGMGVVVADYDGDGWIDVFVTNDNEPNFLFHNLGDGKFREVALTAGVALLDSGKPVASMGADFRDYDNDGWPDLFVTDLFNETFPVFRNTGKGDFRDATYVSRVGRLSAKLSGWGVGLFDFNLDGWKDAFYSCAHVAETIERAELTRYRQPNAILINERGVFRDGSAAAGPDFQVPRAHRGMAVADFNGDGKPDVVVTSLMDPVELWENVTQTDGDWLIVKLQGVKSNRDGIGARLKWRGQTNTMSTSIGYASSGHVGVHFGAPKSQQEDTLEIWWPGGKKQTLAGVKARRVLLVKQEPAK